MSTKRRTTIACSLTLGIASLLTTPSTLDARVPVEMRVSPTRAFAPADVEVSVTIESDDSNRAMTVTLESRTFFRESAIELEGNAAPRTSHFQFRALPPGDYEVRVQLLDSRQRERGWARRYISLT